MIPLDKGWYQRLLLLAPVIGVAGGGLVVIFTGHTGTAAELLYDNTGTGL